jgi:hypothetical protein
MTHTVISSEFLLWSETCLLWAIIGYGITADPLPDETNNFPWRAWKIFFILRCICGLTITFLMSRSILLGIWILTISVAHPLLRLRVPPKWTAESECSTAIAAIGVSLILIRYLHLSLALAIFHLPLSAERVAAISILVAVFVFVIRGGTYIVRGYLKKAGTVPHLPATATDTLPASFTLSPSFPPESLRAAPETLRQVATGTPGAPAPQPVKAADSAQEGEQDLDLAELNRGRLIGNLERILLTIVVAAGSYAALGFLVAAKGLIRSEEFEKRDFTEYFLIGSLTSVLIALSAGLVIRYVLVALWPDLLMLQMQS